MEVDSRGNNRVVGDSLPKDEHGDVTPGTQSEKTEQHPMSESKADEKTGTVFNVSGDHSSVTTSHGNVVSKSDMPGENGAHTSSSSTIPSLQKSTSLLHPPPPQMTTYVWLLCIFAAIGGFLFGYDTGVVSGAMLLLQDEFKLSYFWQEVVVSVTIGGAFVSSLAGGFLNDRFGRKAVTIAASSIFTVGTLVLGVAQNLEMLVAGRLVLGVGIGFASMTVPVYIAECAPAELRGRLVTVNNLFITGGQFVASLMDGALSYVQPDGWRYMLGIAGIPSIIQFFGFFFLPESPRWLMKKGRQVEARKVLEKLRGGKDVDQELSEMRADFDAEESNKNKDGVTIIRILKTPPVRRALLVGCALQLFQQLSGINTVMYYSASIIRMAGVGDQHMAIWLSALTSSMNFLFTLVGVWLVERIGRKKLLMGSLFGTTLSLILLAVAFQLAAVHSPDIGYREPGHANDTICRPISTCEGCIDNSHCGFCFTGSGGSANGSCLPFDADDDSHSSYGACVNSSLSGGVTWASDYCPTSYSWMAILGLALYLVFFAPGMGPMPWTINSEIHPLWARSTGNSLSAATNWISNLLVSMTFLTLTETITKYGMGPMPWTINSEIHPLWARSTGNSLSAATNWISNLLVSMTFLTLTETITKYGTYWMFVGITLLGLLFFAIFLPETKGKRLEEVEQLFASDWCSCCGSSNVKANDTRSAHCVKGTEIIVKVADVTPKQSINESDKNS
ncbi:proton myo-inositol cotransporter [Aplysia californica]|uniref:Proton myo-inositol cotransporter n=1 Tax=Aplysia californica TaxID=6500 RepID=A0ABM1W3E3_APLCA|nr:proton myo-inositol cotransporter [Aplysia californica]